MILSPALRQPFLAVASAALCLLLAAGCARKPTTLETGKPEAVTIDDLLAADPAKTPEEAKPAVRETLAKLIAKRAGSGSGGRLSPEAATQALIAFGLFEPEADQAIEAALPLIDDSNRDVRYHALRVLAPHRDDSRVREAATRLKGDADPLIAGEARLIAP